MNHEQRESTPPLKYAYNIEGHTGVIHEEQRFGTLSSVRFVLEKVEKIEEVGVEWYCLYLHDPVPLETYPTRQTVLFSGDCDEEVIQNLTPNEILTRIQGFKSRPDVCFGRQDILIAGVLTEDKRVVYKSPGFDLETYMQKQSLRNKNNEHKK